MRQRYCAGAALSIKPDIGTQVDLSALISHAFIRHAQIPLSYDEGRDRVSSEGGCENSRRKVAQERQMQMPLLQIFT
jgi:hypothetical protein